MKKRTLVALALAVVFVMAVAAPALANSISYTAGYNIDGTIDQKMQAGHLCNTGAEMKQTISGTGALTKGSSITMVRGKLTVGDVNDFVTAPDAVRNLTITSVIELCTPPKYTVDIGDYTAVVGTTLQYLPWLAPVSMPAWYNEQSVPVDFWVDVVDADAVNDRQIWAVQVSANPGFSGNLHQKFEAAYGPFSGLLLGPDDSMPAGYDEFWAWQVDEDGKVGVLVGDDYVGDYFSIEQFSRTSSGVHKRYIDISSPWSHGYLYEDFSVTGMSEVTETFTLGNLPSGIGVAGLWWDLF